MSFVDSRMDDMDAIERQEQRTVAGASLTSLYISVERLNAPDAEEAVLYAEVARPYIARQVTGKEE